MQERPGQGGDPRNRPSAQRIASLNGTGKVPTIPQRPPRMARVSQPPRTTRVSQPPQQPRVARPKRETVPAPILRRRLLILGSVFIVCALLACGLGFALYNFINAANQSAGASTTTADFLNALNSQNYDQAYKDLGPSITLHVDTNQFSQQAKSVDSCYGTVENYQVVPDTATNQGNTQSYTYSIKRTKLASAYKLTLTLQQDPEDPTSWKISDYGNTLGPDQNGGACK